MKTIHWIKYLAWINIVIAGILVIDTFLMKPVVSRELFKESSNALTRSLKGSGYRTYYVNSFPNNKYRVPEETYLSLNHSRDSFLVRKSKIFKRPLALQYEFENKTYFLNIGVLNGNRFIILAISFIIITAIINLRERPLIKHENFNQISIFLSFILIMCLTALYFGLFI